MTAERAVMSSEEQTEKNFLGAFTNTSSSLSYIPLGSVGMFRQLGRSFATCSSSSINLGRRGIVNFHGGVNNRPMGQGIVRALSSAVSMHGTTIVCVRKGDQVCMAGDGQVSQGSTVVKGNARKVRRIGSLISVFLRFIHYLHNYISASFYC